MDNLPKFYCDHPDCEQGPEWLVEGKCEKHGLEYKIITEPLSVCDKHRLWAEGEMDRRVKEN